VLPLPGRVSPSWANLSDSEEVETMGVGVVASIREAERGGEGLATELS